MARIIAYQVVSCDNHIDLTFYPTDLWPDEAPSKWKFMVPRVEELDDGLHWFTDGQDAGMWNGVGPGFGKYEKGRLARVDKMHDFGFYSGPHREAGLPGRNNTSMIVGYRRGMSCR